MRPYKKKLDESLEALYSKLPKHVIDEHCRVVWDHVRALRNEIEHLNQQILDDRTRTDKRAGVETREYIEIEIEVKQLKKLVEQALDSGLSAKLDLQIREVLPHRQDTFGESTS